MNCAYCGREVKPTIHRREAEPLYKVDYFRILTGNVSPVVMQTKDEEAETFEFLKLTEPKYFIACVECMAKPETVADFEEKFRGKPPEAASPS